MSERNIVRLLATASLVLSLAPAEARVVSYAPITDLGAIPAYQKRTNRFFVLAEGDPSRVYVTGYPTLYWTAGAASLVVHDSAGLMEPRAVLPEGAATTTFAGVAAHEGRNGVLRILTYTSASLNGDNASGVFRLLFSGDGGTTWKVVAVPPPFVLAGFAMQWWVDDHGGPFCQSRTGGIRTGTDEVPFVIYLPGESPASTGVIAGIKDDGTFAPLALSAPAVGGLRPGGGYLVGSNAEGTSFLAVGAIAPAASTPSAGLADGIYRVGLDGSVVSLLPLSAGARPSEMQGWLGPDGTAFVENYWSYSSGTPRSPFPAVRGLYTIRDGIATLVLVSPVPVQSTREDIRKGLLAVPTHDFTGAWVLQRGAGLPTVLSRLEADGRLTDAWRDVTAPEVEALHVAGSGTKLLIQVNRPRPQVDQRLFRDPALAVWEVGQPAPRFYDELFLVEQYSKGFVHLDVDASAAGAPFTFDSSLPVGGSGGGGPSGGGGSGGGADVTQEWGVVKGSLKQKLVLPSAARASGMMGSFWKTDLVLHNPDSDPLSVELRFVPSGVPATGSDGTPAGSSATVILAANEIKVLEDLVGSTFGRENASGAVFLSPEGMRSVEATSRTYTATPLGTYGMGVGTYDLYAAASPRFPVTYSGALLGMNFRTNAGAVDVSGRGAEVSLKAAGSDGWAGSGDFTFSPPVGGHGQVNGLAPTLDVEEWRTGAINCRPLTGEVIPFLTAIDNRTNDPTYFPPDLPANVTRILPALVHVDGAQGSRFRSDLLLYNNSDRTESVRLVVKRWDSSESESVLSLTLFPREAKTIRDVLSTAFAKTGVARLRFSSSTPDGKAGIRVTSRTYSVAENGGTYGFAVPPFNSFQMAGSGESLEILGPVGGIRYRTNLALVDSTAFADGKTIRVKIDVYDQTNRLLDSFDVNVPVAGGIQVDDIFRTRGLGDGPAAALIRISPAGGLVGAYATTIDQGTNDPTYFAAGLAASN